MSNQREQFQNRLESLVKQVRGLYRIALANIRFPATPDESVALAEQAIVQASVKGTEIICFPEHGEWPARGTLQDCFLIACS